MRRTSVFQIFLIGLLSMGFVAPAIAQNRPKSQKKAAPKRAKSPPQKAPKKAEPPKKAESEPAQVSEDQRSLQRGERIEFDARLIQGQTAKAGAVYLFERVSSNLRSMVKERLSFRDKIVHPVFPKLEESKEP